MQLAPIMNSLAVPGPMSVPAPGFGTINAPLDPPRVSRAALELEHAAAMLPADDQTEIPSASASQEVRSGFTRYARWAKTLRSMPGIATSGWRSSRPDDIQVWTNGPGWTKLLARINDGSIEGARLDVGERGDDGSGSFDFLQDRQFQINAVSALPGVSDWTYDGAAVPGEPVTFVRFTVTDADRAAQLAKFVRPELGGMPVKFVVG